MNMTTEKIKEYLGMVLDMEKALYVQSNTIKRLYGKYHRLGNPNYIAPPEKEKVEVSLAGCASRMGTISGIVCAILFLIYKIMKQPPYFTYKIFGFIWYYIVALFWTIVAGVLCGLAGAGVLGLLLWIIYKLYYRSKCNKEYKTALQEYNKYNDTDRLRVTEENKKKQFILKQIRELEKQERETKKNLNKMYSYNIIHKDYQHNMVAISSFYQYFCKGITFSLQFDPNTGDDGAYKIYENEMRLGAIIGKLDNVITRLDEISANQGVLYNAINEATSQINSLSDNIDYMSSNLSDSIDRQTKIQEYNTRETRKELHYMSLMNDIYHT